MMNSGKNKIFYNVLDNSRTQIPDKLSKFKNDFYLAGGTSLALQIGHRISVDFNFFTSEKFDNLFLIEKIKQIFFEESLIIVQNEVDILTILLNDVVKISFFKLGYNNFLSLVETQHFDLASIKEIGVMKLLALFRATYKDYVDLYYILKIYDLNELITIAEQKHPDFEKTIYLKALLSFDDVDNMPIRYLKGFEVDREKVFAFIERETIRYIKDNL